MFPGNEDGWLTALHYHILSQVSGGSLSFKKTNQDTGAISCNLDTGRLILVRRRRFMTRDTEFAPAACLVTAGVADTRAVGTVTTWDVATEAHANRRGLCGLMRFAANRARGLFHK